jgi:O-antigen/teichoic acid export membrane protein
MIIVTIASVSLNLFLIPRFQAVGASVTVLASNFLMTALGIYWARKTVSFNGKKIFFAFGKIFAAAAAMGAAVFYLKTNWNIFWLIPLAAVLYVVLLFLFKTIGKDEVSHVCSSFTKK